MRVGSTLATPLLLLAMTAAARADDGGDVVLPPVAIHGFVSPGYLLSTNGNNYIADTTHGGSVEFTEAGINFTSQLTDRLRVGFQLFTRDHGPVGNYNAKVDWFYLDYRWQDWFGLRAGRIKIPFGLYNENSDTDVAHVPILLPQSVYPLENRDYLLAQTGGEVYGYVGLGGAGALDYRLYGGTIYVDRPAQSPTSPYSVLAITVPYLFGGRVMWETPATGLRVGASVQELKVDSDIRLTQPTQVDATLTIDALLWIASAEYTLGDLVLSAEYSRWPAKITTKPASFFPTTRSTAERAYIMMSYRFSPCFQLGLYYSLLFPDTDDRKGRDKRQHDVAATLRFDIEEHWVVKLEGHYMNGTAALNSDLNEGRPLADLSEQWAVFLVKTSAWF